jgi:copper homeostasis protein
MGARPSAPALVEICVEGIASALAAGAGGADRIELCENLAVGGVTPSAGAIAVACERVRIPVHVLVRPRGGDFVYDEPEEAVVARDIAMAKGLGASGVVVGALTPERRIDRARTARWIEAARPLTVTFHKAFDETADPFRALDELAELGVDRILTSGQASTAREGLARLAELARRGAGRLVVLAGGAIGELDVAPVVAAGLTEIHLASAVRRDGRVDPGLVRRIVDRARPYSEGRTS